MERTPKGSSSEFARDVLEGIREKSYARSNQAADEERIIGIEKAVAALYEAKVKDEKIISLLQKFWDLRLSEAEEFLRQNRHVQER